jgi:hypothetical protein
MGRPKSVDLDGDGKWLTAWVSGEMYNDVSAAAAKRGVKMSVLMREALRDYLDRATTAQR